MARAFMILAFLPLTMLVIVPTLFSAVPGKAGVFRVCDFPRIQLLWIGLGMLAIAAVLHAGLEAAQRDFWFYVLWTLTTALLLAVLLQAWWAMRMTPIMPCEISSGSLEGYDADQSSPRAAQEGVLRVIASNVDYENENPQGAVEALLRWDPHLLALAEPDEQWEPLIERLSESYPWKVSEIRPSGRGLALLSKFPIEAAEIRHLVEEDRPSIWADLSLPGNGILKVVVLHPPPPGLPSRGEDGRLSSARRDIELELAARVIGRHPEEKWLVAGDLNDVGWSATTARAKRISKLGDPRVGRGMYGTFPASWPLWRYPIDHLLVSKSMRVLGIRRLKHIGSDHLPLMADFELQSDQGQV